MPHSKNTLNPFYTGQHCLFNKREMALTQFICQMTHSPIGSMYRQLN